MYKAFTKPSLTYEEQIQLLKKRGMLFKSEEFAKQILKHRNYYRLSAYWFDKYITTSKKSKFIDNLYFEEIYTRYEFDRELKLLLLDAIERIEVSFKSHFAYESCHFTDIDNQKDPFFHLKENNFMSNSFKYNLNVLQEELKRNQEKELFISHYQNLYGLNIPPIWVCVEIMSFGSISKFFQSLRKPKYKKAIAKHYRLPYQTLQSWLQALCILRNKCAHHARVYNTEINKSVSLPHNIDINYQNAWQQTHQNLQTYNFIVCIIYLLKDIPNSIHTKFKFKELLTNIPNQNILREAQIPLDWCSHKIWDS